MLVRILLCSALLIAVDAAQAQRPFYFSSQVNFVAPGGPYMGQNISEGDEIDTRGRIVRSNAAFLAAFCPQPPAPDAGLDALHVRRDGTLLFSVKTGWFDECLGLNVSPGDLLNADGHIVYTNHELMRNFHPMPIAPDVGLDAVHELDSGEVLFSTETNLFDEQLGVVLSHGDVLSDSGYVYATNAFLLRNFCPMPPVPNFGCDALYLPGNGEIWFSTEGGWLDHCLGMFITDGDLLSDAGYIVRTNAQLMQGFAGPGGPPQNVGLEDIWTPTAFSACGVLRPGPQGCFRFVTDDDRAYFIEHTGGFGTDQRVFVRGYLNPRSQLCPPITGPGIEGNEIYACFEGCGMLVRGVECTLFMADAGGRYVLDNRGGFNVGDRVWVTGGIEPGCVNFCQQGDGCIHNDAIGLCFDGCGRLVAGPQCVRLQDESGLEYWLENTGGLIPGSRVRVRGCLSQNCGSPCGVTEPRCIRNNTIIGPLADLNCDGVLNNFDIDPFVLALVDPARYVIAFPNCDIGHADVDCDGLVNNFDIDPFVALLVGG